MLTQKSVTLCFMGLYSRGSVDWFVNLQLESIHIYLEVSPNEFKGNDSLVGQPTGLEGGGSALLFTK